MKLANYNQLENFLIDNISDFHFGLLLCMHTGIRVGELAACAGKMIFAQEIRIQRTVIRIKISDQTVNLDTGKSPKPACTSVRRRQNIPAGKFHYQTNCFAKRFSQRELIYILSGTARCMEPGSSSDIQPIAKTCGIPPSKIHALRHQFSCRWVEHGFDTKSLSEILGHTSVRTTLDLYVHIRRKPSDSI